MDINAKTLRLVLLAILFFFAPQRYDPAWAQSNALFEKRGIVVNPIDRSDIRSLVDAGTIDTDGYTELILNMAGMPGTPSQKGGTIGVILIPDIPPFDEAFLQWGILPAVIELTAEIKMNDTSFIAKQKRFDVGFPRYRLLFYNTTDSTMKVAFFAYRTRR